jgi:hypothetical protein
VSILRVDVVEKVDDSDVEVTEPLSNGAMSVVLEKPAFAIATETGIVSAVS